jgi:hypothetical protein
LFCYLHLESVFYWRGIVILGQFNLIGRLSSPPVPQKLALPIFFLFLEMTFSGKFWCPTAVFILQILFLVRNVKNMCHSLEHYTTHLLLIMFVTGWQIVLLYANCYMLTVSKLALSFTHLFIHSPINYCHRIRIVFLCTGSTWFSIFSGVLPNKVFVWEASCKTGFREW